MSNEPGPGSRRLPLGGILSSRCPTAGVEARRKVSHGTSHAAGRSRRGRRSSGATAARRDRLLARRVARAGAGRLLSERGTGLRREWLPPEGPPERAVLLLDDGRYWFELRAVTMRGRLVASKPPSRSSSGSRSLPIAPWRGTTALFTKKTTRERLEDPAIREYLGTSLVAPVATLSRRGVPALTPLWFVADRGHLYARRSQQSASLSAAAWFRSRCRVALAPPGRISRVDLGACP